MLDQIRPANRVAVVARRTDEIVGPSAGDDVERRGTGMHLILWRRRWIVLGCILTSLVSAYIYLLKATPVYSSNSVVYVQQSIPKIISDEFSSQGNSAGYLFTQCMVIQSTTILSAALEKPGVSESKCLAGVDNPVAFLKSAITAVPGKQGDLITVSMESTNPQDAATIVNAVVESFIDYQSKQHQSTAVEVLRILQKERDSNETELKQIQDAMFAYRKASPDIALDTDKGNINMQRLASFNDALTAAQLRQLDLQMAVDEANLVRDDPVALRRLIERLQLLTPTDSSSATGQQAMVEYLQDRDRLSELLDEYGPAYPEVRKAQHRVGQEEGELTQATQDTARAYIVVLREALTANERHITELQNQVDHERKAVLDLSVKDAEFEQLAQQRDRVVRAIDLLDTRMKDINVTEDVGALTVSVLEYAKPELRPVRPKHGEIMGMALVAGLMVGLGGAMLRDMLDQRLRSAEEIAELLDLPILGAVPHMVGKVPFAERGQEIHLRPRSDVSEAYRTIRTAIYFGLADVKSAKTILITSPAPSDGKSTVISNLAIAIAQAGRRVLMIDADCRRPILHKMFNLAASPGLSSILAGKSNFAAAVQKTSIDKLEILQCGPLPHNPAEILNSQAFLDLLREASEIYDQILIDSPPVMLVTDARILGASCDVTVLVLRAEKSTRRLAEHASDAITSVGGSLIGVVVNDVPRGQAGYGYYYYGYGYGKYGYTYGSNGNGNGKRNGNGDPVKVSAAIVGQASIDDGHKLS
jgi:capsular exopolysaccharide synthesis family protein